MMAAESKAELKARSQRYQSLVLKHAASTGQINVAESINLSEATVSRFLSEDTGMERACLIFASLGLKVVPQTHICVAKPMYDALVTIAAGAMNNPETVQKLVWEE